MAGAAMVGEVMGEMIVGEVMGEMMASVSFMWAAKQLAGRTIMIFAYFEMWRGCLAVLVLLNVRSPADDTSARKSLLPAQYSTRRAAVSNNTITRSL